MKQSFF